MLSIQNLDKLAPKYSEGLSKILDDLVPEKNAVTTKHPQFPWFTSESSQLKRAVRHLESHWIKYKSNKERLHRNEK